MVGVKFALALIVLAVLFTCAVAQENVSGYSYERADYWYKRGLDLAAVTSFDKAIDAYDKAIEISPEDAAFWESKAAALGSLSISKHDFDRYSESLEAYRKAIELYDNEIKANPNDANAWYYRGFALSDMAATMQAGKIFNTSANGDEQDRIGYLEDALNSYDKAIEISPKYVAAWKNKGMVLYKLEKYNESLQAYDRAIEIDPKYALAWYNKGLSLYKLGMYNEALHAYDEVANISAQYMDAAFWYNKGNALAGQGNYDAAVKAYDRSLQIEPSLAEAWYGKGVAFEKLGVNIGADAAFAKAKDLGYEAQSQ